MMNGSVLVASRLFHRRVGVAGGLIKSDRGGCGHDRAIHPATITRETSFVSFVSKYPACLQENILRG